MSQPIEATHRNANPFRSICIYARCSTAAQNTKSILNQIVVLESRLHKAIDDECNSDASGGTG